MSRSKRFVFVLAVVALLVLVFAGAVRWRVSDVLRESAKTIRLSQDLKFISAPLPQPVDRGVEWISAPASFNSGAVFQGKLYVGGPAGLLEFDHAGNLTKHYRAGIELPPSPIICLSQAMLIDATQPELLMATASEGVIAFDGTSFRQIRPAEAAARSITSVLPLKSGQLLIGTLKRGLLLFDGKTLRSFHSGTDTLKITELAGSEADLWIGTIDSGVFHWQGGRLEQFDEMHGLPDRQVQSIAVADDSVYVGTPMGVAEFKSGRFAQVLAKGVFARSLGVADEKLFIGGIDQGLHEIRLQSGRLPGPLRSQEANDMGEIRQIFTADANVYLLSDHGLYLRGKQGGWKRALSPDATLLHDRNISALAFDSSNNLWVGYFDHGMDVLEGGGKAARHVESDRIFCVNRIVPQKSGQGMAVATANGLVLFNAAGHQQRVLAKSDGLLSDHVTDVLTLNNGIALATPAGLTFMDSGGARSLYSFQGLVNNHVYTLAASGNRVLAGTLGGISILDHERVVTNYTTSTSGLRHNWISAIVPVDNEWMIGTYGAGVMRLNESGKFETFDIGSGKFEVNPNAMLVTEHHVYAGSLGHGLYSYNRESGKWNIVSQGLPSTNVTALASGNGYIYIGTDNGLVRVRESELP